MKPLLFDGEGNRGAAVVEETKRLPIFADQEIAAIVLSQKEKFTVGMIVALASGEARDADRIWDVLDRLEKAGFIRVEVEDYRTWFYLVNQ